jgi:hypothetical protein
MPRAFVIRPFGPKKNLSGALIDFNLVHRELIAPALKAAGLAGETTGEIIEPGNIREDMFALIIEADLVVCDITIHNANVFYELGIRHALRKKRTVMIRGVPSADDTPFDILTDRYQPYPIDNPGQATDQLADVIRAALSSIRETDSPIFKFLPSLPEADPASVAQVVPMDLIEEVERATAAKSKGWLRLLAADVEGRRFQWPAFRLIGQAQWDLEDWEGARKTFDRVRVNNEDDVIANLALANIYERQYRRDRKPETLRVSDQAIDRVLTQTASTTAAHRAEAIALKGRNQKTLWRLGFEGIEDVAIRREQAANRALRNAYENYRSAYLSDLNHFWPGLAALQLGWIALDLCRDKENWEASFESRAEVLDYTRLLKQQVAELRSTVALAVDAALERLPPSHPDRVWAETSPADLSFLFETNNKRVIRAYRDAVSRSNIFAWGAAKGQLQLFASLGIKADLVAGIIAAVEAALDKPDRVQQRVLIFAGHQIDEPGRSEPRFPEKFEPKARALIRHELERALGDGPGLSVLASAASGSDILCHELCRELQIPSTICLPMPKEEYARQVFASLDTWRSRYFELVNHLPLFQLSDRPGLPRWLQMPPPVDPWERGNRWVLEMGLTSGAAKVTLLALWDGKDTNGKPGGTGHMIGIARQSGAVDIIHINSAQILAD